MPDSTKIVDTFESELSCCAVCTIIVLYMPRNCVPNRRHAERTHVSVLIMLSSLDPSRTRDYCSWNILGATLYGPCFCVHLSGVFDRPALQRHPPDTASPAQYSRRVSKMSLANYSRLSAQSAPFPSSDTLSLRLCKHETCYNMLCVLVAESESGNTVCTPSILHNMSFCVHLNCIPSLYYVGS
ncbi:hypothetical protein PLICRDRAFT_433602 [Plicaturopsis crispa FD-325 SS-3]|uniref:Uncharacterized protein n=1 Tax=Plicaturopsis crispa FD-325 SS-3 TaxID=944288 RepID=A0A0C9T3Q8_PLICR|nr:hypothetical protein PLICRDRAFT_433602 [Plicaturopsis crispa FD-325 SS-3]